MATSKFPPLDRGAARRTFEAQRTELLAALRSAGLGARIGEFGPLIRDTVTLSIAPKPKRGRKVAVPIGTSRLGGVPDLSASTVWPRGEGEPLSFVGQISLADVAPFDIHELLPPSGLLSFFAGDPLDDNEVPVTQGTVLFFEEGALLEPATPPEPPSWWAWGRSGKSPEPQGLTFAARAMLPPQGERPGRIDTEYRDFHEEYYDLGSGPIQHGMLCFDMQETDLGENEQILLRLDEDQLPYSFDWVESVRLYFIIGDVALKKRLFSSARAFQGIGL